MNWLRLIDPEWYWSIRQRERHISVYKFWLFRFGVKFTVYTVNDKIKMRLKAYRHTAKEQGNG